MRYPCQKPGEPNKSNHTRRTYGKSIQVKCIYLLKAIVIVSVELAHGHSASGLRPLDSNALRNESQADSDPG